LAAAYHISWNNRGYRVPGQLSVGGYEACLFTSRQTALGTSPLGVRHSVAHFVRVDRNCRLPDIPAPQPKKQAGFDLVWRSAVLQLLVEYTVF